VCQRTVRWAHDQRSTNTATANGHKVKNGKRNSATSGRTRLSDVPQGRRIQQSSATNPNGRLTWYAPNNEQCRVWCAPDCRVRPSTKGCCFLYNNYNCGGGYKYTPTTTIQNTQAFNTSTFNTRAMNSFQDIQSFQSPQVPQLRQVISDLRESDSCFICCSCCLAF
jgi:hypothetical protein